MYAFVYIFHTKGNFHSVIDGALFSTYIIYLLAFLLK